MSAPGLDLSPLRESLKRLKEGGLLGVLTGGGILVGSTVPSLRDNGGIWEGERTDQLVTAEAFERDPGKVWRFHEYRRAGLAVSRPTPAHFALVQLERMLPQVRVVTQTVDGLHLAAGSNDVTELRGSLLRTRCLLEGKVRKAPLDRRFLSLPPYCPECGGVLRPDVVWTGETLPEKEWQTAESIAEQSCLFLVAGLSSVLPPASLLGIAAARAGSAVWEINPDETPDAPLVDGTFRTTASEFFPALIRELGTA